MAETQGLLGQTFFNESLDDFDAVFDVLHGNGTTLNSTEIVPPIVAGGGSSGGVDESLMTIATFRTARRVLKLYINVILGAFGILTNTATLVVLTKIRNWKSYNILLAALSLADLLLVLSSTDVPGLLYFYSGRGRGFHFSYGTNIFLYYTLNTSYYIANVSFFVSITIPLLIIFERALAVFLPFKFPSIITPKRTFASCLAIYIIMSIRIIPIYFELNYLITADGVLYVTYTKLSNSGTYLNLLDVTNYITGPGYLSIVIIGTIVIGLKVKHVSQKRMKLAATGPHMTDDQKSGVSHATKTLLSVCIIYSVTNAIIYIIDDIRVGRSRVPFGAFLFELNETMGIVNSSCNFFVYAYFNKKFKSYFHVFRCERKSNNGG